MGSSESALNASSEVGIDRVQIVASCPEEFHNEVMDVCTRLGMPKAYGKKGDFVDNLDGDWRLKWQVKVCQTVLLAAQVCRKCEEVEIICIRGGPKCNEEQAEIPKLVQAISNDIRTVLARKLEVSSRWVSIDKFMQEWGTLAQQARTVEELSKCELKNLPKLVETWHHQPSLAHHSLDVARQLNNQLHRVRNNETTDFQALSDLKKAIDAVNHSWRLRAEAEEVLRQKEEEEEEAVAAYPYKGFNPSICQAALNCDVAAVRGFARRDAAAVHRTNPDGNTALHQAAWQGHKKTVQVLLAAKASVEMQTYIGERPLHKAAFQGHLEVVQLLVAARATVASNGGQSPLQLAESKGHQEVVRFLRAAASQS